MDNLTAHTTFVAYLARRSPGRSTAKHYGHDVQLFQAFCPKPWSDVTPHDIDAFVTQGHLRGWKPATIQRRVAALHMFFEFCAEEVGCLDCPNPVQPVRHAPKRGKHLPRDVSDTTIQRLWAVIEMPRDQAIFILMLRAGLRVGEVVSLTRSAILAPATAESPARLRVEGKGRKERIVYLSTEAYTIIERWLQLTDGQAETPLFPNWRGQRLTVAGVQERLRHYCVMAGVHVTCHQLRHTFARQLAEHDMPVTSLAKLLGHTHLDTTQLYIEGANPEVRRDYTAAMARWRSDDGSAPARSAGKPEPQPPAPAALFRSAPSWEPPRVETDTWAQDLPAWVRQPCLAAVQHQQRNWKPSLRQRHTRRILDALAGFWRWQLAHRPTTQWTELTRDDLQAYVDQRLADGRAVGTIKNVIYPLLRVLRHLEATGVAVPPSLFRLQLPKGRVLVPRHLTDWEAHQLERYLHTLLVQDTPAARRDAAWLFVLAHTGIRLHELLDLRRADLDLSGARLRIQQGKGRRDRVVYVSTTAVRALQRYLAQAPCRPQDPLFRRTATQPLRYRWVHAQVQAVGEAAGVAHVSPHRLRHTFATRLINMGVPVTTIQKLLGHEQLSTTQRYLHVADSTVEQTYRQAMAQLEQADATWSPAPVALSECLSSDLRDRVTNVLDNSM